MHWPDWKLADVSVLIVGYNYFHWYIGFYPRGKAVPQGFKNATAGWLQVHENQAMWGPQVEQSHRPSDGSVILTGD